MRAGHDKTGLIDKDTNVVNDVHLEIKKILIHFAQFFYSSCFLYCTMFHAASN